MSENQMRVRTVFAKTEAMRYTGHLDLFRALERTLRRAGMPLVYSQEFNPRPKINLASALALGITSDGEVADFWLKESLPIGAIKEQSIAQAPPGIEFLCFEEIVEKEKKLQNRVKESNFRAEFLDPVEDLETKVETLMKTEELIRERTVKKKLRRYDLRPLIIDLKVTEEGLLIMHLKAEQGATGRPDEVLKQLGIDPASVKLTRTALVIE